MLRLVLNFTVGCKPIQRVDQRFIKIKCGKHSSIQSLF